MNGSWQPQDACGPLPKALRAMCLRPLFYNTFSHKTETAIMKLIADGTYVRLDCNVFYELVFAQLVISAVHILHCIPTAPFGL